MFVSSHSSPDSSSEEEIYATPAAETPSGPCDDNPVYHLGPETDEPSIPVDSEPSTGADLLQSHGSDRERARSLQDEVDGPDRPIIRRVQSQPTKTARTEEEAGDRPQENGKKQTGVAHVYVHMKSAFSVLTCCVAIHTTSDMYSVLHVCNVFFLLHYRYR